MAREILMSSLGYSFIRAYRRKWKLSQAGLARLVGAKSSTEIARIERGERAPRMEVIVRCWMLFGADIQALYPHVFEEASDRFMQEASTRFEEIKNDPSDAGSLERQLLSLALRRVITHLKNMEHDE